MPYIIAVVLRGLLYLTGSIVGKALLALGIGAVSYTGMAVTINWAKTQAVQYIADSQFIDLLSYMKVGTSISIVFSAMLARAAINGLNGGTLKRWVMK